MRANFIFLVFLRNSVDDSLEALWSRHGAIGSKYLLVVVVLEDRYDSERTAKKEVLNANRNQSTTITI
jgi:hypothetical protein